MKNKFLLHFFVLLLLVSVPSMAFAVMESYCSAPPYVTRTIAPNIMIVMDNSEEMLEAAYTDLTYSPNATKDNYYGYFKSQSCYEFSGGKFKEPDTDGDGWGDSTLYSDDCPASAPFRGNLLNWATMSKYDVLQKVIVGGNTTSKQGNAHTLVGISDIWPVDPVTFPSTARYYNGCEFRMDNGNLTILDHPASGTGTCPLLVPAAGFALESSRKIQRADNGLDELLTDYVEQVTGDARHLYSSAQKFWENIDIISNAWAAQPCSSKSIVPGSLNGKEGETFYLRLTYPHKKIGTATWAVDTANTDVSLGTPVLETYDSVLDYGIATWQVDNLAAGIYDFDIDVTSTTCDGASNYTGQFVIESNPPIITHYAAAVEEAVVGIDYSYTITGQGGLEPRTWSISSGILPSGLSLDATTGEISGTPATGADGDYTFTVLLSDDAGSTASKELTMTVYKGLAISTGDLSTAWTGVSYLSALEAVGGNPVTGYNWTVVTGSLPDGMTMNADGEISGTPTTTGSSSFTVEVTDASSTVSKDFTLIVDSNPGNVQILSGSSLPSTFNGDSYSYDLQADGGCLFTSGTYTGSYKWWVDSATSLPSWMTLDINLGKTVTLSGTPDNTVDTTDTFTVWVEGCGGHQESRSFSVTSKAEEPLTSSLNSKTFAVKIVLEEEPIEDVSGNNTDLNGNGIADNSADLVEDFQDKNGNGIWDGKKGIFHQFWDSTDQKARWGMTKFRDVGTSVVVDVDTCVPVSTAASFYTSLQNATAASSSALADGLYGAINYYGFDAPYGSDSGNNFVGCTNSDPIDNIPCRKNFILMITSGNDVSGSSFPANAPCEYTDPLVQNACYGYQNDLRAGSEGRQNVHTYIVNTMGSANNDVLLSASNVGGGNNGSQYFEAVNAADLENELTGAIEDILAQAASGTAVSVLTTSSRGIGSMMQAYFLPIRQVGTREVRWTGYVQNLWIDPDDNLREDTVDDYKMKMADDMVLRLFFDESTNETKAALFESLGDNDTLDDLENCTVTEGPKDFSEVNYTWEGGYKLATRLADSRNIFTARNVIHGTTTLSTSTASDATFTFSSLEPDLKAALDADATYSVDEIIGYTRGECRETGATGNSLCTASVNTKFRDRRVDIPAPDGGNANGYVWKLGDVISSTPKVLASTPNNTYHIDYGDTTYYNYISNAKNADDSDGGYAGRSSIAFVGANDGMLHAFRVGYLKDKGLTSGVLGLFKDFIDSNDSVNTRIGEEVWGYIPYNALPYLKYLADPEYCHIYYNDLSVRLTDASINGNSGDAKTKDSWRTILIGGMRFGGACDGGAPSPPGTVSNVGYSAYYAIDVTDAENPVPLWEFSDPDMGFATGYPSILRTGSASSNGHWYVTFGSGSTVMPKSHTDIGRDRVSPDPDLGYLYILDLETGERVQKIELNEGEIVGDVLAIDKNKDYITEKIYFGTSYYDTSTSIWKGRLVGMDIPNQDLGTAWSTGPSPEGIFTGDFPFTASPDAASDVPGNTWVYGGSGKYYSDVDESTLESQIFVGIKDDQSTASYPVDVNTTGMVDKTSVETTGTVTETTEVCTYDPADTVDYFSKQTVVTKTDRTSGVQTTPDIGWYISLVDGERIISRPLAVGGLVDFLTYKPSSDECSYGGDSYLYAVGYTTGEAPNKVAIRNTQTTGDTTTGAVTIAKGIRLGPGAPPTGEAIIIPPPKEAQSQLKKKIQVATGVIVEAENTPAISVTSEIVHWLKK